MNDQLSTVGGTFAEQRAQLGELLGTAGPVSPDVLVSALADREYAQNLLLCKHTPVLLDHLLAHPPRRAAESGQPSAGALLASASRSFWDWARSGFEVVDEATFQRRFGACRACPDLVEPPRRRLYQIIGADGSTDATKVCARCGCVASRKARLPNESCPAPHPELAGLNRWGEPVAATRP